jgi:eukaryotic-like serine/threonine-protein kinase
MTVLAPDERFEGYVVDTALGHGGHGTVYRARDAVNPACLVALKVLDEHHREPAHLARLQREFEFAHQLDHPHIVTMYESGPGWLAMELVDGGTVAALPTKADRLEALVQIAEALDFAHHRGIVHCDVKPCNILVSNDLPRIHAVLIDFGVAHSVAQDVGRRPTKVEASLPYSAPELLYGRAPTAATDEYALACTLVELITGAPPFAANTPMGLIEDHLHRPPPQLSREISSLPHAFDSILAKAMAKSADNRYDSCTEFVSLITRALR